VKEFESKKMWDKGMDKHCEILMGKKMKRNTGNKLNGQDSENK